MKKEKKDRFKKDYHLIFEWKFAFERSSLGSALIFSLENYLAQTGA